MEFESWGRPARGLREYFRQVATACGCSGEAFSVHLETPMSGYIPIEARVPAFPELDVALVWDARSGWSAALETTANNLAVLSYLDVGTLPTPSEVAEFAAHPSAGAAAPGVPMPEDQLFERLSSYTDHVDIGLLAG